MQSPDGSGIEVPEALLPLSWLIGTWVPRARCAHA